MQIIHFLSDYSLQFLLTMAVSYILGSLSFSIIFTRLFSHADVRTMGSGNAGFTNVLRCVGVIPSILTFVFDFLKAVLSIFLATLIFNHLVFNGMKSFLILEIMQYLAGISCILGHMYPCFFNFKGGKGVITVAGTMLFIDYRIFIAAFIVFAAVFLISKIISLSSISAAISLPISIFLITFFLDFLPNTNNPNSNYSVGYIIVACISFIIISLIVVAKHKSNIQRIIKGEEKKISVKK